MQMGLGFCLLCGWEPCKGYAGQALALDQVPSVPTGTKLLQTNKLKAGTKHIYGGLTQPRAKIKLSLK